MPAVSPFSPEALEANRRGELSNDQRRNFGALSRYRRRNALSIAAFLLAGALLVAFFASPASSAALRSVVTIVCVALAGFLVLRSATGTDALTQDLRQSRVESIEGATGKRRFGGSGGPLATAFFLEVGDSSFKVSRATYSAAPDAGIVRLYFLPRSRTVVGLERLPNAASPEDATPERLAASLGAVLRSHGRREANEARAEAAALGEAVMAGFAQGASATPPQERDSRPLADAIVGTWKNTMMSVTFSAGGRVTIDMIGGRRDGHWSVDADGRLRADITGSEQTADAWVAGDRLTIAVDGRGLLFTRAR